MKLSQLLAFIFLGIFTLASMAAPELYKVVYRKGEIKMERSGEKRKVFKGDFLLAGDIIRSGDKGMVILGFGEGYRSRMKIGPMSNLTLEGKKTDNDDNGQVKTFFFLKLGNILVQYINKNKDKNRLKVLTKSASVGIRGTEFFVQTTQIGETFVAVRSGVVLAKHKDKKTGIPLTSKEGVIFTMQGASSLLVSPKWYKDINWEVNDLSKPMNKLNHNSQLMRVGDDSLINKMIKVSGGSLKGTDLKGQAKAWQKECKSNKSSGCTELALYLLKNGHFDETKEVVMSLFNKACALGDPRSCVWGGRVEHEVGKSHKGILHIKALCEDKRSAYACYSLWEIYKADKSGDEARNSELAAKYLQKSLAMLNGLDDFEGALAQFKEACNTDNATACLNYGILLEQIGKLLEAKDIYKNGCELGSGAACSNLGYIFQSRKQLDKAKKQYKKACFMDEAYGCYNLSCLYSKEKKIDLSKQYLRMAVSGGFDDWAAIEGDQDLKNLKRDVSYAKFKKDLKSEFRVKKNTPDK